jgi:hypothetical protein
LCRSWHGFFSGWRRADTLLSCHPHRFPNVLIALINGVRGGDILQHYKSTCQHQTSHRQYSTTLVVLLTSCLVASDSFNFCMACFRAMLRSFLGGASKLASRLDGFSMTGMTGIPARLNFERSWNRCCSVFSSSSSDLSSMTIALSRSLTSRRTFALVSLFPCACPSSHGGKGGTEMYFTTSPTTYSKHEHDYFNLISTRGLMPRLLT